MPAYGYPDWERGVTAFAYAYINDVRHQTIAGVTFPTVYAGSWPYVRIDFKNDDGIAFDTVQIAWSDDQTSLIPGGHNTIAFGAGDKGGLTIPVLGPFMQVSISSNVNATADTRLLVYGTSSDGKSALNTDQTNYHLAFFEPTLAANASTAVFGMNFWYTGWTQVMAISNNGGPAYVVLTYLNASKTSTEFIKIGVTNQTAGVPQYFYMPPNPVFWQIFNGSTGQTIELVISPAPR